jgi:nucleotidyltransferase/DNA polymerase involved in DNA repair
MPRIAFLRIPRFQVAVHQKRENLKGKPFALVTGKLTPGGYSRARIFMCASEASRKRVRVGMRLSEAKAVCSDLVLEECDDVLYNNAQNQLLQTLVSCSPKVTSHKSGEFSLDASGLLHMGGETKFCHAVLKLCAQVGFPDARIGIADSTFAAMVATRLKKKMIFVVPKGQDKDFLAPLSISHLELEPEMEEVLLNLGIKSMAHLADLPPDSLVERFDELGKWAYEMAQGKDDRKPRLPVFSKKYECVIDMGGAISSLNQTIFAFKALLNKLTADLQQDGLWAEELHLSFFNEDDCFDERMLRLIRPSSQAKFLLEVTRLSLEAKPLAREFTKVKLTISRFSKQLWEQAPIADAVNVRSTSTISAALLLLLQRFLTKFGEQKAVKPIASDHYDMNHAGAWVPVVKNNYTDAVIPVDFEYLQSAVGRHLMPDLVLRKCLPKSQVMVELQDSMPSAINHNKTWYRVKEVTTPEYLSGNWWEAKSAKSYYKVLAEPFSLKGSSTTVSNASLILLVHDQQNSHWYVEGYFD